MTCAETPAAAYAPPAPLTGMALVLGTLSLSLATFMNVLDSSIANVSLPAIAGDLGVSPAQGTWVITSFGVANAISMPLTGWLTQRFGAVRLFCMSVLLFVLTSWLCGFAHSLETLVLFRVLQGLVAGPMIPLSQSLLLSSYPASKAGSALGLWSLTTLVAPVAGPLLGGWLTDNMSWPWIFYINIPVGLVAVAVTWILYRKRETPRRKLPIDTVGLSLLIVWVAALQLMLDLGKESDWFASTEIVVLGLTAVVSFAVFVVWELTDKHPVVDLKLFARPNFTFGVLSTALAFGLFFGNIVLLPLWLQQWMGYNATSAAMTLAPVGLFAILLTPLSGRKVAVWDPRLMATGALLGFGLIFWMRAQFTPQVDYFHILIPTLLQGAAISFMFLPMTTLTLAGLSPERIPAASGLSNFVRMLSGALGVSISTTLWESRATLHHAHMTELMVQGQGMFASTLSGLKAAGLNEAQALAQLNHLINQQAYTRAADDIFLASSIVFLALIALPWLTRRPSRLSGSKTSSAVAADAAH
jgi:DHA2 family multidrug resistance protein